MLDIEDHDYKATKTFSGELHAVCDDDDILV